jgi:hypothetical protein
VDDALADGGAGVVGVGLVVAGVVRVVGADVVVVLLAGGAAGVGFAAHPAVALGAADAGAERVVGAAVLALVLVVFDVAALAADALGGFPHLHADQRLVGVLAGGPGPVLARDRLDLPLAGALAGAGVAGPADDDFAGVLGVGQDAVDAAGGPRPAVLAGRPLLVQPLRDGVG